MLVEIATIGFTRLHQQLQQVFDNKSLDDRHRLDNIGVAYIEYAITNQS